MPVIVLFGGDTCPGSIHSNSHSNAHSNAHCSAQNRQCISCGNIAAVVNVGENKLHFGKLARAHCMTQDENRIRNIHGAGHIKVTRQCEQCRNGHIFGNA